MKKTNKDSRIEIWRTSYVGDVKQRQEVDKDVIILQIEYSGESNNHYVEIIEKDKYELANISPCKNRVVYSEQSGIGSVLP